MRLALKIIVGIFLVGLAIVALGYGAPLFIGGALALLGLAWKYPNSIAPYLDHRFLRRIPAGVRATPMRLAVVTAAVLIPISLFSAVAVYSDSGGQSGAPAPRAAAAPTATKATIASFANVPTTVAINQVNRPQSLVAAPTETEIPSTVTPAPTDTPIPTATLVPPTATVTPTETPIPPTATAIPPTPTLEPTSTPMPPPPTATPIPPPPAPPVNTDPVDATAKCSDGTYSYSQHRSGTCSHHGGVAYWINRPPS
jgi:hypothetical protein